jgi:hypothetical protein
MTSVLLEAKTRVHARHWLALWFAVFFFSTGCTKSPGGSVEELIKTNPPNFGGLLTKTFLSPSTTYQLDGNCDPISYATQWSYDNSNWTDFSGAGGCPNGTFTLTVNFAGRKKVYVRSKTKTGYTATAIATIKLLLPPTSPHLNLVNGSSSDNEDNRGMQSSIESMATAISATNGTVKIQSSGVDAAYAQ